MTTADDLAGAFEAERPYLRRLAYSTLGSFADADDVVQEAWLRLQRADAGAIRDLRGWLTTTVGRLALDARPRQTEWRRSAGRNTANAAQAAEAAEAIDAVRTGVADVARALGRALQTQADHGAAQAELAILVAGAARARLLDQSCHQPAPPRPAFPGRMILQGSEGKAFNPRFTEIYQKRVC